ncbi:MAG: hypothetical protein COX77_04445 [Candidatus Komeilibacteria bacterium CG_4_10_14_0_2_um_filter_37_10]|uniref:Uncharacterized protein n=1 Tax=Candidatus Komeilibacteria bacterium CG_4_10_14_0_2_um_filter_37_10 TaxID=1974470 RepID=A0A2M7VDD3_9BACT|nr:MAG: hypothetical protein COX77_04445 [Candidatus Komeilibacteria bacterium CG_4_10_14_0_2_um_filter_37_10]
MINDNSFLDQQKTENKVEIKRTKEEAQQELMEKFGLKQTWDFQLALQQGKIELAGQWLKHIVENKENFPQYEATWDSWLSDRQRDLELYQQLKNDGTLAKMEHRPLRVTFEELQDKFGFVDTKGFRNALELGKISQAEEWLNYVIENKIHFPHYLPNWDRWLGDRQQELKDAKK